MLKRIWIYLWETFKLPSRLTLSVISVLILYLYSDYHATIIQFAAAFIGMFFSLLYYRICDEFKDEETDKKYFPDRPFPSGRVKRSDLIFLLRFSGILLIINIFLFPPAAIFALILLVDCYLMQKWFFIPNILERNRFYAFLTHSPYAIVVNVYIMSVFQKGSLDALLHPQSLAIILANSLPGFHWEIIRKTFTQEREGYETYSSIFGYRNSLLMSLPFLLLLLIPLNYLLQIKILIPMVFIICSYIGFLLLLAFYKKQSPLSLQKISETISTVVILALLLNRWI